MTEHFTQAGMKDLAGGIGISFYPRYFSDKNLTDLCNAAVNHKLQEWGAQEPVAYRLYDETTGASIFHLRLPTNVDKSWAIIQLYTRALPAQPAQDVNAGLVDALEELCDIVEGIVQGTPAASTLVDSFTTQPARAALSQAQPAPVQYRNADTGVYGPEYMNQSAQVAPAQPVNAEFVAVAWKHEYFDHAVFQESCPRYPESGWFRLYAALANAKAAPVQGQQALLSAWMHRDHSEWADFDDYAAPQQEQKGGE